MLIYFETLSQRKGLSRLKDAKTQLSRLSSGLTCVCTHLCLHKQENICSVMFCLCSEKACLESESGASHQLLTTEIWRSLTPEVVRWGRERTQAPLIGGAEEVGRDCVCSASLIFQGFSLISDSWFSLIRLIRFMLHTLTQSIMKKTRMPTLATIQKYYHSQWCSNKLNQ